MNVKANFVFLSLLLGGCPSSVPLVDAGPEPSDASRRTDASPDRCETEMAMRAAACGDCGLAAETCMDGAWVRTSECLNEGECAPGMIEAVSLPMCAERQRICDDECSWRDWTTTELGGECEVGDERFVSTSSCPSGLQRQRCSARCVWEAHSCDDGCGATARTTPEWKREVCIPAGPFLRGFVGDPAAEPIAELQLSAYYLDAYPVTNARWTECMSADACDIPYGFEGRSSLSDPTRANYPIQGITFNQAVAFCAWDGGRRLPTQAQWEKAARGPAPRAQRWVWAGDAYRCDLVAGPTCPGGPSLPSLQAPDPYDGLPGSQSFYGTFLQYGGLLEFVSDFWVVDWYSDPSSQEADPTGPPDGRHRTYMGVPRRSAGPTLGISTRGALSIIDGDSFEVMTGFRCARPASL